MTRIQRELISNAREFSVGPLQLLIGGVLFDVKSLGDPDKQDARLILADGHEDDYLDSAILQDGREIEFRISALQAVIDGSTRDF